MSKTVLITGGTDGIGESIGLEFAKQQYTVHVLGRSKEKGEKVLKALKHLYPDGNHQLFLVDLSVMKNVNVFLDMYINTFENIDVLILNAGIHPNKHMLSADGIDLTFSVGYISRYLFSIKLNTLLEQTKRGKVVHINGSVIGKIHYNELHKPNYNKMTSVWQNALGSALLTYHWHGIKSQKVDHMHWNPGIVNTQTVKSQNKVIQFLSKLMGMVEPNVVSQQLVKYITTNKEVNTGGKFYVKGQEKAVSKRVTNPEYINKLIDFSEDFTGVNFQR